MTDGWRIHCAPEPCEGDPFAQEDSILDYLTRAMPTVATITTDPVLHASRAAIAVKASSLRLSLNGYAEVHAKGDDASTTWQLRDGEKWELGDNLQYSKVGPDATIGLDPKFLRDAVSGMGKVVRIAMDESFVRITDGERVAVIMRKGV